MFVTPSDEEEEAFHQPWLDDDILSREYVDTTPNHQYTSTDHHHTSGTIPHTLSPYHTVDRHLPDCAEACFTNSAGSTSSHTAAIGINLTPSRVRGHSVSISVTPNCKANPNQQLDNEPLNLILTGKIPLILLALAMIRLSVQCTGTTLDAMATLDTH